MTEITSLKMAGREMPLTSPTRLFSALLSARAVVVAPVPPVPPLAVLDEVPASNGCAEFAGRRDVGNPLLAQLVVLVLESR